MHELNEELPKIERKNNMNNDLVWDPWEIEAKEITGLETQPRGWLMKKKGKVNRLTLLNEVIAKNIGRFQWRPYQKDEWRNNINNGTKRITFEY